MVACATSTAAACRSVRRPRWRKEVEMRKDRLVHFRKKLEEKHRQLTEEVEKTVLYGKGPEDDSIKDLGDQASSAYNREFLFELGSGDRRLLKEVTSAIQKLEDGGFGDCERCGEAIA